MSAIARMELYQARIPFRSAFKHGSAERIETESVFVWITDRQGISGYGEACPRAYVTGESIETVRRFFSDHAADVSGLSTLEALREYLSACTELIDSNPAAWCAIGLALLDCLGRQRGQPVESLFGDTPRRDTYRYSAVIGDCSPETFRKIYQAYRQQGLSDFKIKLANDVNRDRDKLACLAEDREHLRVRADANNLWPTPEVALDYLARLDFGFDAIEEPVRSGDIRGLERLHDALGVRIILDESFLNVSDLDDVSAHPEFWIINARISKFGGLSRSLDLIERIKTAGIDIIVGAQVGESSLLTRAALIAADAAGARLLAQEGAFSELLLQTDPFIPKIRFGREGKLSAAELTCRDQPGWGLAPAQEFTPGAGFTRLE